MLSAALLFANPFLFAGAVPSEHAADYFHGLDAATTVVVPAQLEPRYSCLVGRGLEPGEAEDCLRREHGQCNPGGLTPCPLPVQGVNDLSSVLRLTGTLPSELGQRLPKQKALYLGSQPELSGRVGPLAGLANLTHLSLRRSKMSGTSRR